jgi:hypothetical protein
MIAAPGTCGMDTALTTAREADMERIWRCSDGHCYSANWVKAMLLSVHFGIGRHWQRCPVDGRWRMARAVSPGSLTESERDQARANRF